MYLPRMPHHKQQRQAYSHTLLLIDYSLSFQPRNRQQHDQREKAQDKLRRACSTPINTSTSCIPAETNTRLSAAMTHL